MPTILLNGERRKLEESRTVAALLSELGMAERGGLAVEVNLAIVPRSEHVSFLLKEGDRVEIVTMMAGS